MEFTHRLFLVILAFYIGHQDFVPHSPEEFFKVHRIHINTFFLRWNDNILYVFLDGDEGACFKVIKGAVLYQRLDSFPGAGAFLHFIEDNEGFAGRELFLVVELDVLQKGGYILQIFIEPASYPLGGFTEIDEDVGVIFVAGEFLCYPTLAGTAGTLNQDSCRAVFLPLPLE